MFKKKIAKILKKFDLKILKISKNQNSFEILLKLIKKHNIDLTLDIGANIGQFAIKLRDQGYNDKIISFEPLKKEHDQLKNISQNDKLWEVYARCAIGDIDGNAEINISSYSPSSSILNFSEDHKKARKDAKFIGKESIKMFKLDTIANILNINKKNIFLKIDTQGYENNIIKGADNILKNCKILFCEVSLKRLYEGQELWIKTIELLKDKGFLISFIENSVFDKNTHELLQADIVFVKND